ncbi:unnamed protein product [Periconia digitata]|uniref:Uncharacterized protein n=1 Tax=Periconia digitata TaxID=1303443 RepID=A0A9W4XK41_9PLEO|nr:unnamed protein product [Periconia digitata]
MVVQIRSIAPSVKPVNFQISEIILSGYCHDHRRYHHADIDPSEENSLLYFSFFQLHCPRSNPRILCFL